MTTQPKNWEKHLSRGIAIDTLKTINKEFKVIIDNAISLQKWNSQLGCYTSGDSAQAHAKGKAQIGRHMVNKSITKGHKSNRKGVIVKREHIDMFATNK